MVDIHHKATNGTWSGSFRIASKKMALFRNSIIFHHRRKCEIVYFPNKGPEEGCFSSIPSVPFSPPIKGEDDHQELVGKQYPF
jgi:hypothetical protein